MQGEKSHVLRDGRRGEEEGNGQNLRQLRLLALQSTGKGSEHPHSAAAGMQEAPQGAAGCFPSSPEAAKSP